MAIEAPCLSVSTGCGLDGWFSVAVPESERSAFDHLRH